MSYCKKLQFFISLISGKLSNSRHSCTERPRSADISDAFSFFVFFKLITVTAISVLTATAVGILWFILRSLRPLQTTKPFSHMDRHCFISSVLCGCLTWKCSCIFMRSFWIHHRRRWWHLGKASPGNFIYIAHFIRSKLIMFYIKMHTKTSCVSEI